MSEYQEFATMTRHHGGSGARKTPEPVFDGQCQPPPTPRPRFKLKRRHAFNHLAAPTQQFLASVAAADVPLPSVEEPAIVDFDSDALPLWRNLECMEHEDDHGQPCIPFRRQQPATPPKTPAPEDPPSLTPSRYPNWNIGWTSDCESSAEPESRPSTSRSTQTSTSSFSQLSSSFSDEAIQFSPEIGASKKSSNFVLGAPQLDHLRLECSMSKAPRKAPWTKAMGAHLWATYNSYLTDPLVTPFQIGKSGLPPEGVCQRVAREAARSWKGAKAVAKPTSASDAKSGTSTPTAELSGAYIQWPHTGAATRAQLRLLCKQKARGPDAGRRRFSYLSRSPTPFSNSTARWVRSSTPGSAVAPFGTYDMAKALAISTSEAMDPKGPLAQMTNSAPKSPAGTVPVSPEQMSRSMVAAESPRKEQHQVGSTINAQSYGPSASSSLTDVFGLPAGAGERQICTVGPRQRLQSPVRLGRSSTQKRKIRQAHEARKRPSLSTNIWFDPISASHNVHQLAHNKSFSVSMGQDDVLAPGPRPELLINTDLCSQQPHAVPMDVPQRLGSPFSVLSSSFSVPNRTSQPIDFESSAFGRRFTTMHPALGSRTNEPASLNLASRLAYIDQRLKDFNTAEGHS